MEPLTPQNSPIPLHQWHDYEIRKTDPYAETKYRILLSWLGEVAGKSALIIGVGSGEFAAYLAQKGARVLATDIDEEILKLARATASSLNVKVDTAVARIETVSLDERYDIVCALDVLEHVQDDLLAMQRLATLTKKGTGILLLTVPALPLVYGLHDESLGHYRRYTKSTLRALVARTVQLDQIRYFGLFLVPVALLLSRVLRRPYPAAAYVPPGRHGWGIVTRVLWALFGWEARWHPPLGVSLLVRASLND